MSQYRQYMISVLYGMRCPTVQSYLVKICHINMNKTELVRFKKSLMLVTDWRSDCKCCKMFTLPRHGGQNS